MCGICTQFLQASAASLNFILSNISGFEIVFSEHYLVHEHDHWHDPFT